MPEIPSFDLGEPPADRRLSELQERAKRQDIDRRSARSTKKSDKKPDISLRPRDEKIQEKTRRILGQLPSVHRALSGLLTKEELSQVRIQLHEGVSLETNPPVSTGTIVLACSKDKQPVTLTQPVTWREAAPLIPSSVALDAQERATSSVRDTNGIPPESDTEVFGSFPSQKVEQALLDLIDQLRATQALDGYVQNRTGRRGPEVIQRKPLPAQYAAVGDRYRIDSGEVFVKTRLDLWKSDVDGGMVDDATMNRMLSIEPPASTIRPGQRRRIPCGEWFTKIGRDLWQSETDQGRVDDKVMDKMFYDVSSLP